MSTAGDFEKARYCIEDALSLTAEHGHFEVLKWIYGTQTYKFHGHWSPMGKAVANGHLAIAQWLHEVKGERCSAEAVSISAKIGYLEVLQWLHSKNLFTSTRASMRWAAIKGRRNGEMAARNSSRNVLD
ncbi:hypothetical protein PHYSODRAFT_303212 [Phytophthora sojae]|uniref:Uncharacterized protein n=1 Tax=Phytophthora sojae (strain P6497) TaxID=1094619 RepID=G4ZRC9_PHYSP|nr:hypothetical protein PHYSODRAFT_303212 [Phytophthora sojae]EGZ13814.1 hypothetical protein PHYSODRAFT_303212 [Phytophthora sojae]|eukprot:XP_009531243.1 hypothetical protein PHYSODRAFT_303212 [Phytophthora sojae]